MFAPLSRLARAGAILALAAAAVTGTVVAAQPAAAAGLAIHSVWSAHPSAGISQSSPVPVTINGRPSVVVGDSAGGLHAYNLATGAVAWQRSTGRSSVLAPLSTNGSSVFVGMSSSAGTLSTVAAFTAGGGATVWNANSCAHCLQLGGVAVRGSAAAVGGAAAQVYGLNPASGGRTWTFTNSDSTNSTPAVGDLYGTGGTEFVFTDDQTGNAHTVPPAQSGGHLRIINSAGQSICNANLGGGPASPGSFDSSPALVSFGSSETIVFGTGASGTNPNRILAYNDSCQPLWASPALAGPTIGAPAVADVLGDGVPVVVEEVANAARQPVVYEIDVRNHKVLRSTTLTQCKNFVPGTSSSVVTADLQDRGYQDLIVPAGQCGAYILDGRTLGALANIGYGCGLQNSPVVTNDGNGQVGITVAGYEGKAGGGTFGCVAHWDVTGASLGSLGWPEFHHDPQLSGVLTQTVAKHDVMISGQILFPNASIISEAGGFTLAMSTAGRLVLSDGAHRAMWISGGTAVAGDHLLVTNNVLRFYTADNREVSQIWATPSNRYQVHLVMGSNGVVSLMQAGPTPWSPDQVIWQV